MTYDVAADARHRALREQFLLRPEVVFLNHGSFGACPRPVFERYQAWQRELEGQPVEFIGRRLKGLLAESRAVLADYLGADDDEVVYFPNVTHALNVVARSVPLIEGDEVLTTNHEYGALDRTWRFICQQRGATYKVQPLPDPLADPADAVEALWSGVTPRTKVLFMSHVTSPTAVTLPIRPLIARARSAGIVTAIDGAHAPGQIALDLHALGVDFYGGNCHKWLCAPKGAGFLYARRDAQALLQPLLLGWGTQLAQASEGFERGRASARGTGGTTQLAQASEGFERERASARGTGCFVDEQQTTGTDDPSAYLSVPAAIAFQAEHDWPTVRDECHQLVLLARTEVAALTGLDPYVDEGWLAQMAALPLPPCDADTLKRRLFDEHRVEIPIVRWHGQTWARISVQGYNTQADVVALVAGLRALLPEVT